MRRGDECGVRRSVCTGRGGREDDTEERMRAHILWLGGMGGCNGTQVGTRQRLGDGERRKTGVGGACEEEEGGRGEGGGRRGRLRKQGAYRGGKRPTGEGRGRMGMEEGRDTIPLLACLWTESDRDPRGRKCGQGEVPAVEINHEETWGEMG
ncbi:hypothetical protein Naga_100772g4 [Nannochloropsis gaditana]|uniref:Uncharacterized protein n=1 Tax=Nannochloropsis gaditana TaxID=72520 RepID=W7TRX8_9STRA|nr:hypothetical protein Naga_100772g4 [Nannochloropsis gaditana]